MKTAIASALLLATSAVYAHDNSCDADIHGGVKISPTSIEFSKNHQLLYEITQDNELLIDGEQVALNDKQQALVSDYNAKIRRIVPEIHSIAIEGIDLASEGVTMAFDGLIGKNSDAAENITDELQKIKQEIDARFAANSTVYFDEHGMDGDDVLGKEFEDRIESVVEDAVKNSIGSLMIAIGQEMLFSGGNMDAFEAKMENFGDEIEQQMEAKGERLEQRADALCEAVVEIDELEEQLKQQIDEMPDFDMLTAKRSHERKI